MNGSDKRGMGCDIPEEMHRVRNLVGGHADDFVQTLVDAFAAELEKLESAWRVRVQELQDENTRLRAESLLSMEGRGASDDTQHMKLDQRIFERSHKISEGSCGSDERNVRSSKQSNVSGNSKGPKTITKFMSKTFADLDTVGTGVIKIGALTERLLRSARKENLRWLEHLEPLFEDCRSCAPELWEGLQDDEISYQVIKELVFGSSINFCSGERLHTLNALRAACVHQASLDMVLEGTDVSQQEVGHGNSFFSAANRLWWLETTICVVIITNAAVIGLSMDIVPESKTWQVIELMCTACFMMELIAKLAFYGWTEHFFGADWKWSLFDFLLVTFAVADVFLSVYLAVTGDEVPGAGNLRDVSVLRTLRLFRIARLARLFRMKYMKELALMAGGIVGGVRTLFWAIVMLFFFVYVFGIMTHQIMLDWKAATPCDDRPNSCSEFDLILYTNYGNLFGDLFKTCFTVIRCVTGDCNFYTGAPVAPVLVQTHGKVLVVAYVCSLLFVSICVFNLLMAIFVENTLEYAQQDSEKQEYVRHQERIQRAQKLQALVDKIMFQSPEKKDDTSRMWKYLGNGGLKTSGNAGCDLVIPTRVQVAREEFDVAMDDLDDVLDFLDVNIPDKSRLFDILDADGNGFLHVHEIVEGIIRLRGPAHKSDIVSNGLMIRSVQRSLEDLRTTINEFTRMPQPLSSSRMIRDSTKPDERPQDLRATVNELAGMPEPLRSSKVIRASTRTSVSFEV